MKFKITFLFIIIFISMLAIASASASEDISENMTSQSSPNDEDALSSDGLYYTDNFQTSISLVEALDNNNATRYVELTYSVWSPSRIVNDGYVNFSSSNQIRHMIYATSKGTFNQSSGIWDIGEFYGQETIKFLIYNGSSSCSWNDFKKTDEYSNILKEFKELNQTNKLINPNVADRVPYYVDLILKGNMSFESPVGSDYFVFVRNFTVQSKRGIAENTTVEYHVETNFTFQRYEASKGTYDPVTGIWDVGDVYGPENLTVYSIINKEFLISIIDHFGLRDAVARTTTPEVNTLNNILTTNTPLSPTSTTDTASAHYQLPHFEDYSDFRSVEVEKKDKKEEKSYEDYKRDDGEDSNPQDGGKDSHSGDNRTGTDNQNSIASANGQNINNTESQQNGSNLSREGNSSSNLNVEKSINLSSNNVWIVLAVLILCVVCIGAYKKFKS